MLKIHPHVLTGYCLDKIAEPLNKVCLLINIENYK